MTTPMRTFHARDPRFGDKLPSWVDGEFYPGPQQDMQLAPALGLWDPVLGKVVFLPPKGKPWSGPQIATALYTPKGTPG